MRDDSIDFVLRFLKAIHDDCNSAKKPQNGPCVGQAEEMIDVSQKFAPYFSQVADDGDDGGPSLLYHQLAHHLALCSPLCRSHFEASLEKMDEHAGAKLVWAKCAAQHASPMFDAVAFQLRVEASCDDCGTCHSWFPIVFHLSIELPLGREMRAKYGKCG